MNAMYYRMIGAAVALGIVSAGCSSSDSQDPTGASGGQGTLVFETWGEDYIEKGIDSKQFADGWSIHYDKFLVSLGGIEVADAQGEKGPSWSGHRLIDLTKGRATLKSFENVSAKHWDRVAYEMAPAGTDTETGKVSKQDAEMMKKGGYAVYVEGSATKDGTTKTFHWGFAFGTRYEHCRAEVGGSEVEGVVLAAGSTEHVEITVHGDHLFYDDLQSPEAKLRFEPIAKADADGDGEVTLEELAKVKLVSISDGTYGTGSASDIDDLRAFVEALSETIGHFRGEGHCSSVRMK